MKKFITILLALILFAGFAGCGTVSQPEASAETETLAESESPSKAETKATPAATIEATAAPTPSPTPEPITYQWDGIELVLDEISDNNEVSADIGTPSGKFVAVTLSFEGELIVDDLVAIYKELFTLTCGGESYSPVAYIAQNATIDHERFLMVSTGPLVLYFDLPVDLDISDAVFVLNELS